MGVIVYTAGVFDMFHIGHLNVLRASKSLGDRLVVGVVSDAGAAQYKRRPLISERDRIEIIRNIRCVDEVYLQPTTDPTPIVEIVRPDIFTHGNDWSKLLRGQETLSRLGIRFVLLPYTHGVSTTELRHGISAQQGGFQGAVHPCPA